MPSSNYVQCLHESTSGDGYGPGFYSGGFKVEDYKVSDGELNDIYPGYVAKSSDYESENGWLRFDIDRYGSKGPADFWNAEVADSECTFNDDPKELNFAIKGTLTLTFRQPDRTLEMVFPGFYLGQGYSGSTNNCWVGVHDARQGPLDYSVMVRADNGREATSIHGGGLGVNKVMVRI